MALCPGCSQVIPCHCHVPPPVEVRLGVYQTTETHTRTGRELNECGYSAETIPAEYETDAALAEWPDSGQSFPSDGHYFHAALRAEDEQRAIDWQTAHPAKEA